MTNALAIRGGNGEENIGFDFGCQLKQLQRDLCYQLRSELSWTAIFHQTQQLVGLHNDSPQVLGFRLVPNHGSLQSMRRLAFEVRGKIFDIALDHTCLHFVRWIGAHHIRDHFDDTRWRRGCFNRGFVLVHCAQSQVNNHRNLARIPTCAH